MLSVDVFDSFVVRVEHKWLRFMVMTPLSQSSHYSIEFFIIGAVVAFRAITLLTEISKRPLGLN